MTKLLSLARLVVETDKCWESEDNWWVSCWIREERSLWEAVEDAIGPLVGAVENPKYHEQHN